MKVLTAEQMYFVDSKTIEEGTPGLVLMRNAGKSVFDLLMSLPEIDDNARIVIVAGKGNNGGDGFRIAELLARNGYYSAVYLLAKKIDTKGDAALCMHDALNAGAVFTELLDESGLDKLSSELVRADVVIDAIFGTGLKGEVTGLPASVIKRINDSSAAIVAVDIPSGVDASTGDASSHSIWSDFTATFGALKVGHVKQPGRFHSGEITVNDIGFSPDVMESAGEFGNALLPDEAIHLIPQRPYNAHKGTAGRLLILAGSVGLTGAATLSSIAALRSGAGLVTLGCPASLNDILEVKLTEVMTLPLPEVRNKRCLSTRALGEIRSFTSNIKTVAVGPGLGRNHETGELVRRFISQYDGNVILDADGIYAFKGAMELLDTAPCSVILTPHAGELATLMGEDIQTIVNDPKDAAQRAAKATGSIVLLKGAPTIIAHPSGEVWINPTGNESMATAGMGDLLTGVIAGFVTQGLRPMEATVLGAYIHGASGDIASEFKGVHGVIAGDVLEFIPEAILETASGTRWR